MNQGNKINAESKKKKKPTTLSVKTNTTTITSNTQSYYIPKVDPEKSILSQKSARSVKNETSSKLLKSNQSVKEIKNSNNKSVIHIDTSARRAQTSKLTAQNQEILENCGFIKENIDTNTANYHRWSDIPTKTHDLSMVGQNSSTYKSTRQRLDSIIEEQKSQARHQRTNSHSKTSHTQYQPSIQVQPQPIEVARQQYISQTLQNKNISKVTKTSHNTSGGMNNTNNSFVSQEAIIEESSSAELRPKNSKILNENSKKPKPIQKSPEYFEIETVSSAKNSNLKSSDRMNIEESLLKHLRSNSKEKTKDPIKIIEEPVAQFHVEPKSSNPINYSSLPPQSNTTQLNTSGLAPNYSSNPVSSGNMNNAQNASQKNLIQENPNKKPSTGKSSNPISNNSSYMKPKGRKSSNTQKTESTCVSGEESPPVLDCDEIINNNFGTVSNNKAENNFFLVEKFDPEPKSSDSLETEDKRAVLRDITEAIMKSDSIQEELANFNPDNSSCAIDSDTITYLVSREIDYSPDSHYFDKKQNQVTWIMRAILFDWMMEVCMEFTLKRETYHYSVNYVDRYLSSVPNIQKWELQLVGVTAMYIASKVEEIYAPKVSDFAKSADNGYTTQQIMDMEMKMLKGLKWLLNPPTLNTWANWYLTQWDLYVENSPYAKNHPLIVTYSDGLVNFKQPNEKSYARFREFMQIVDCAMLDIQTLQYKPRTLIAAFMYLTIGKHYKQFTVEQIYEEFPNSSLYLLDQEYAFNDLFADFLLYSFGFQLVDLLPSIQYASTYFKLPLNFDLPTAAKINKENVLEGHFEEFLAYQTHHPLNVDYIRKRPRNVF